jgi:hypothetical protein
MKEAINIHIQNLSQSAYMIHVHSPPKYVPTTYMCKRAAMARKEGDS